MPEMYPVILSNQSIKNLTGIVEYIAAENPDAADKLGFELVNLAMGLDSMPYRGSKVKKRLGVLKLVHGNYVLYYRVDEGKRTVQVINFKRQSQIKIRTHGEIFRNQAPPLAWRVNPRSQPRENARLSSDPRTLIWKCCDRFRSGDCLLDRIAACFV